MYDGSPTPKKDLANDKQHSRSQALIQTKKQKALVEPPVLAHLQCIQSISNFNDHGGHNNTKSVGRIVNC